MPQVKIELTGLEEGLDDVVDRLANYALYYMYGGAVRDAPKDTGYMADHIDVVKTPKGGTITSHAPYSGYVEYGTQSMTAAHGKHDPKNPVTDWKALRDRGGYGQTMPFMRPQAYKLQTHLAGLSKEGWNKVLYRGGTQNGSKS